MTRQRVIDAAIETIVELGFDLASSREILRRAGYTWGVLQYHFGSREGLLLAVLQDSADRFTEMVSSVTIPDGPAEDRIEAFLTLLDTYYGSPRYVAVLEIIFNLSHNPDTRSGTLEVLRDVASRSRKEIERLLGEVVGPARNRPSLQRVLYNASRGFSLSTALSDLIEYSDQNISTSHADIEADRRLLARALASVIEGDR